jgi:hypothetical protein
VPINSMRLSMIRPSKRGEVCRRPDGRAAPDTAMIKALFEGIIVGRHG